MSSKHFTVQPIFLSDGTTGITNEAMKFFLIQLLVISILLWIQLDFTRAQCLIENQSGGNTIQFSIKIKKNQTDHQVMQFQLNEASAIELKNWKGDFLHNSFESQGIRKNYIMGTFTVPPQRSEGYEFFPGIGYYKLHTNSENFVNASNICRKEGAHLAIINSEEEAAVLSKMLQKGNYDIVWVGFHDPRKNRDFRTIFGTFLNETGFSKWREGQPDGAAKQFCGYFDLEGLGDVECEVKEEFFCEHDLSWDDF